LFISVVCPVDTGAFCYWEYLRSIRKSEDKFNIRVTGWGALTEGNSNLISSLAGC
jgi:hypothetical protein